MPLPIERDGNCFVVRVPRGRLWWCSWRRDDDGKGFVAVEVNDLGAERVVRFARRWKAKDRAYRWACRRAGAQFVSQHLPRVLAPALAAKMRERLRR